MLVTSSAVDGVLVAVDCLVGAVAAVADEPDVVVLSDVDAMLTARARLDAAICRKLAVADARAATVTESGRGTRAWLVEEQGLENGAAARKVRLGRQLYRWEATEAAWLAGDISEDHVAVIVAALRQLPASVTDLVEQALLEIARVSAPHQVSMAVDAVLVMCGIERSSEAAAAKRYGTRGVTVAETFGGTGSLHGTLTAVLRDKLQRALEIAGKPAGPDDERSMAQRYHDALESIVDHFLDTSPDVPAQLEGERPARVVVTIPLETLEGRLTHEWGLLPGGAEISPETARRLACDAEVIPAVLGGKGEVLDLGRAQRTFNAHIRRAAVLRDGDGCVFPGCQNARKECHHIEHWAHGGRSDLANAAWLCGFHHWLVHERGWRMRRERDGGYTFRSPPGRIRTSSKLPDHELLR